MSSFSPVSRFACRVLCALAVWMLVALPADAQRLTRSMISNPRPAPQSVMDNMMQECRLEVVPYNGQTSFFASPVSSKQSTAEIIVDFPPPEGNVNPSDVEAAREAFLRAAELWERHIASDVTIRVRANLTDLGGAGPDGRITLGQAGPTPILATVQLDTPGGVVQEQRIIGLPLFEAITGSTIEDQSAAFEGRSATDPEINMDFNINPDVDWYFGTGTPPSNQIDFTSVILHEIGHGLNFTDSFTYNDGVGGDQCDGPVGTGCWGFGISDLNGDGVNDDPAPPYVFDEFMVELRTNGDSTGVTTFPNNSLQLGDALLTGEPTDGLEQLYWLGDQARAGARRNPSDPSRALLYAPSSWEGGSSIAHLDQNTYEQSSNPNRLMTPLISRGTKTLTPGPVFCGLLSDLGFGLGPDCAALLQDVFNLQAANTTSQDAQLELQWETAPNPDIDTYFLQVRRATDAFQTVQTFPPGTETRISVANPGPGISSYRLAWTDSSGEEFTTNPIEVNVPFDGDLFLFGPSPNPAQRQFAIEFGAEQSQDVNVEVYNSIGQRLYRDTRRVERDTPVLLNINTDAWASGMYFIRLTGREFTVTRQAALVK